VCSAFEPDIRSSATSRALRRNFCEGCGIYCGEGRGRLGRHCRDLESVGRQQQCRDVRRRSLGEGKKARCRGENGFPNFSVVMFRFLAMTASSRAQGRAIPP
jgi:hypothetical protein